MIGRNLSQRTRLYEPEPSLTVFQASISAERSLRLKARLEAGFLLRKLQKGQKLEMPHSRPMPAIGERCHELRIVDVDRTWRIIYRVDPDSIVIADVFSKKSRTTPKSVIDRSKNRLREYDNA